MKITQFDNKYSVKLGQGGTTLVSGSSGGSNSGLGGDVSGSLGNVSVNGLRRSVSLGSNLGTGVAVGDVLTIMSTAGTPIARFATPSNSGSAAFGSNATRVSASSFVGASTNSAREDHRHDGIGTVTASASNTMDRGTLNLRAGSNISFALTDSDASGGLDTLTIIGAASSASGGGSTTIGDGKRYIDTLPTSANALDDEFNDATSMSGPVNGLDAKWTKRNMGTAGWSVLSDGVAPGCFYFDIPTGQAASQGIYQTVPSGDWTVAARTMFHQASDRQMWGIFCVSSAGTGVLACIDSGSDSANGVRAMTTWADGGAGTFHSGPRAIAAELQSGTDPGQAITISLRKASGVYSMGFTYTNRLLPGNYVEVSFTPTAFTPAFIGFGRILGTGVSKVMLEFFRRYA